MISSSVIDVLADLPADLRGGISEKVSRIGIGEPLGPPEPGRRAGAVVRRDR